jgi:hypothetical protein
MVASFTPWRPGFDPRPVYVGFTIDKVVMGQVFLGVLRISPDHSTIASFSYFV